MSFAALKENRLNDIAKLTEAASAAGGGGEAEPSPPPPR